ncbi:MAG: hypothetical protein VKS61_03495 [Candidatus Sericytochromatia bacterium]|nr:hypothetical protein [Candidatus Sericytochromatia bacterium]
MRRWLGLLAGRLLGVLRDLSGETALRHRLARGCGCDAAGVKAAWEETHGGVHRCC